MNQRLCEGFTIPINHGRCWITRNWDFQRIAILKSKMVTIEQKCIVVRIGQCVKLSYNMDKLYRFAHVWLPLRKTFKEWPPLMPQVRVSAHKLSLKLGDAVTTRRRMLKNDLWLKLHGKKMKVLTEIWLWSDFHSWGNIPRLLSNKGVLDHTY